MGREHVHPQTLRCTNAGFAYEQWVYTNPDDGSRIEFDIDREGVYFEVRGEPILPLEELEWLTNRARTIWEEAQR